MLNNKTIKLYDRLTRKQVAEESISKLKQLSIDEVLAFFKFQRELNREWDINIKSLINK